MKIFIKLMILFVLLACFAPFFIKGPNGQPLMNINKLTLPNVSNPFADFFKTKNSVNKGAIKVYKWRDENGVVHYADQPDAAQKAQLTELKGITILPTAPKTAAVKSNANSQGINLPSPTTVPLTDVPKLIDDAQQIELRLQQRKQQQDMAIEGLR